MNRQFPLFLILWVALPWATPGALQAQSDVIDRLYGQGVHAYHSGLLNESLGALNQAIELGTRDPRVYFYRGVTQNALGNVQAAIEDFSSGAQFEFASIGRFYSVGRALERIQGNVRMQIEAARQSARLAASQISNRSLLGGSPEESLARPVLSDALPNAGKINLPDTTGRQYPNVPFANGDVTGTKVDPNAEPDPATNDGSLPSKQPAPPVKETAPPTEEPANSEPENAGDDVPPADDNPFGDKPDGDKPKDVPPADDDPFGADGTDEPAGDEPADDDDPFGDGR